MLDLEIKGKTRKRRTLCQYFTECQNIQDYMMSMLDVKSQQSVLEPCAGQGAFVMALQRLTFFEQLQIEAIDIDSKALDVLSEWIQKLNIANVNIRVADTFFDKTLDDIALTGGIYDRIIGNPPYGAWQDFGRRAHLKSKYGGYIKETYTLFIRRCLTLLKKDGVLSFVIPDTFLSLNRHRDLRKLLLNQISIIEIVRFPSKMFPGLHFGYSQLCVLTFRKQKPGAKTKFKLIQLKSAWSELPEARNNSVFIKQNDCLKDEAMSIFSVANRGVITKNNQFLGDVAKIVTGFYSGSNQDFIKPINLDIKGSSQFLAVQAHHIYQKKIDRFLIDGIKESKRIYIPFLKGGGGYAFQKPTQWFLKWSTEAVRHYKTDEKARFQNSAYYFKEGIGLPMVRAKNSVAFLLEKRLFDQSVVGIFPHKDEDLYFLLGFLNSQKYSQLIHQINPTANNSANYIKKIPLEFSKAEKIKIGKITQQLVKNPTSARLLNHLNEFINKCDNRTAN